MLALGANAPGRAVLEDDPVDAVHDEVDLGAVAPDLHAGWPAAALDEAAGAARVLDALHHAALVPDQVALSDLRNAGVFERLVGLLWRARMGRT